MDFLLLFFLSLVSVLVSDCDSKACLPSKIDPEAYVFDFKSQKPNLEGPGGEIRFAGKSNFPKLDGESVSFAVLSIKPCGVVLPHIHPRASTVLYAIDVDNFQVGFLDEEGII